MTRASFEPDAMLRVAVEVAGSTALVVILAIAAYAFGSFSLMGRHVTARELGRSMRELVRELWIGFVTQPFLPLFYLVGHRMDAFFVRRGEEGLATARVPIVFVHGYMQNRVGFFGLARALARRGLGPMFGFNYPWFGTIASNAKRLDRFVQRVCKETGAAGVDLVCHSMGGLVAMEMMRDEASREKLRVRRCVTIATPHAGVVWRGPLLGFGAASLRRGSKLLEAHAGVKLAVPCLSVYSTHDNIVHPKESSSLALRGGRDVVVEGVAHLSILFSPQVAEHVASFLAEPDPV
ncbi:MAG: putative secreted lipase [Labilithrix sp.]|nr:putative secreted lipase [Labilithrix sp.]